MTKEEMLTVINKEIADKVLSLWCRIETSRSLKTKKYAQYICKHYGMDWKERGHRRLDCWWNVVMWKPQHFEVIGHDVMIWDVLEYNMDAEWNYELAPQFSSWDWEFIRDKTITLREKLRKPIEEQSIKCITFIYNLITNNAKDWTDETD